MMGCTLYIPFLCLRTLNLTAQINVNLWVTMIMMNFMTTIILGCRKGLVSKSTVCSGNASLWIAVICFGFVFVGIFLKTFGLEISEVSEGVDIALLAGGCIISYGVIKKLIT